MIISTYYAMKSRDHGTTSKPKDTKRPFKPLPGHSKAPHRQRLGSEFEIGTSSQQEYMRFQEENGPS